MTQQLHLIITGRVQGVCFRAYACREAQKLGLTGWVRNLPDGSVEALAQGSQEALKKFKDWCRHGPPAAHVISVESNAQPETGNFTSFSIR